MQYIQLIDIYIVKTFSYILLLHFFNFFYCAICTILFVLYSKREYLHQIDSTMNNY